MEIYAAIHAFKVDLANAIVHGTYEFNHEVDNKIMTELTDAIDEAGIKYRKLDDTTLSINLRDFIRKRGHPYKKIINKRRNHLFPELRKLFWYPKDVKRDPYTNEPDVWEKLSPKLQQYIERQQMWSMSKQSPRVNAQMIRLLSY